MEQTIIYLVRHGETEWNVKSILQGQSDSPLTKNGKAQVKEYLKALNPSGIKAIYSSDLPRAKHSAEIIASKLDLKVTTSKLLRERNFGDYEGKTTAEFKKDQKQSKLKNVENEKRVATRALRFIKKISIENLGTKLLIVTHAGVLRSLLVYFNYATFKQLGFKSISHSAYIKLQSNDGNFTLDRVVGVSKTQS